MYKYLTYLLPSLRRRFEQNQTDCTFTVLALLPTVTENILEALPVEQLTHELQQKKAERLARVAGEGVASELSSGPPSIRDGDTASLSSLQSSSFIQLGDDASSRPRRSKAQLWNEIKIASITYNQVSHSVMILPAQAINNAFSYRITVIGSTSTGVTDALGRKLSSTLYGPAGGNYTAVFFAGNLPQI